MPIPTYQALMLPTLKAHLGVLEMRTDDLVGVLAPDFHLTEEDLDLRIKSGAPMFRRRVEWARFYILRAGLLERTGRGRTSITRRGRDVCAEGLSQIDASVLNRYPEFVAWISGAPVGAADEIPANPAVASGEILRDLVPELSPEEQIDEAYGRLERALSDELLDRVLAMPWQFFENLVVKLLLSLGYGSDIDSGERLGGSHDDGVDGVIREDALGLDLIYVQAKRWAPSRRVGRPDVQAFVGSLEGQRARKGVFITTSSFASEAHEYVRRIEKSVVLIDGTRLSRLMFEKNLGVTPVRALELKRIDGDFFTEPTDI